MLKRALQICHRHSALKVNGNDASRIFKDLMTRAERESLSPLWPKTLALSSALRSIV